MSRVARPRTGPTPQGTPTRRGRGAAKAPPKATKTSGKPTTKTVAGPRTREDEGPARLQKLLAQAGVASRRAAEGLIAQGRVKIDGRPVTEPGTRVDPRLVRVEVDGRVIEAQEPTYVVLNKPDEVVSSAETSTDPRGRATVISLLGGLRTRVVPLGRLDYHTRGVLLLTNDGALHAALLHPRRAVPKTYHAKFQGRIGEDQIAQLHAGVQLEDGTRTRPCLEVEIVRATGTNTWVQLTISQGLNRQIRRMGDAIGHSVLKLIRVAFAGITGDGLREGQWRHLRPEEVAGLYTLGGLRAPAREHAVPDAAPRGVPVVRAAKGEGRSPEVADESSEPTVAPHAASPHRRSAATAEPGARTARKTSGRGGSAERGRGAKAQGRSSSRASSGSESRGRGGSRSEPRPSKAPETRAGSRPSSTSKERPESRSRSESRPKSTSPSKGRPEARSRAGSGAAAPARKARPDSRTVSRATSRPEGGAKARSRAATEGHPKHGNSSRNAERAATKGGYKGGSRSESASRPRPQARPQAGSNRQSDSRPREESESPTGDRRTRAKAPAANPRTARTRESTRESTRGGRSNSGPGRLASRKR